MFWKSFASFQLNLTIFCQDVSSTLCRIGKNWSTQWPSGYLLESSVIFPWTQRMKHILIISVRMKPCDSQNRLIAGHDRHHPLRLCVKALVRKWSVVAQWRIAGEDALLSVLGQHQNDQAVRCRLPAHKYSLLAVIQAKGIRLLYFYAETFGWNYAQFAMMEQVKLVLVVVLLLTNVFCQEMDVDNWREAIEEVRFLKFIRICEFLFMLRLRKIHIHTSVSQRFWDGKVFTETQNCSEKRVFSVQKLLVRWFFWLNCIWKSSIIIIEGDEKMI